MTLKKLLLTVFIGFTATTLAQGTTEIEAKDGLHYVTHNDIDFPIMGTYYYKGAEPIVQLNSGGIGIYQLHDQPKRPMVWGIESDAWGNLKFKKGFDNKKYTLWYQYTTKLEEDTDEDLLWKPVEFTVHLNSEKMFIQGERSKNFKDKEKKK